MSEWKEYKLVDVAIIVDCEHKTAPLVESSEFISVRTSNISNGKIDFDNSNRVSETTYNEWSKRMGLVEGDVVLAREAPVGEVGWIPKNKKVCLGQRTVLIRVNKNTIDPKYLLFYLTNNETKYDLISRSTGSVVEHLNVKDIKNFEIRVHSSIEEQSAIASILSSLDDKIDLLHRQNKTLEQLAETLFRQWFIKEVDESWEKILLGELADFQRGISYSGNLLGENGIGMPMHNLNSIDINGSYKYKGIKFYTGEVKERQKLRAGDLLIINTDITQDNRIIGWPIFVPEKFEVSTFSHHLYSTTLLNGKISKLYLYFLLRQRIYRETLASNANGTTVSMLSKEAISNLEVRIPPESKRSQYEEIAKETFDKQTLNQKEIRTLTQLRDALLPKLMSGELRVCRNSAKKGAILPYN